MNVGDRGITFVRTSLAKQDRPNHEGSHIFVPSHQEASTWIQEGV